MLAAFFYGLPGVIAWARTLRREGTNETDLLMFSLMFAAGPLLTVLLLRVFQRAWLVSFAMPTSALALLLCLSLEYGGVTKSFLLASALVGVAVGRTLWGFAVSHRTE